MAWQKTVNVHEHSADQHRYSTVKIQPKLNTIDMVILDIKPKTWNSLAVSMRYIISITFYNGGV